MHKTETTFNVSEEAEKLCQLLFEDCVQTEQIKTPCNEDNCYAFAAVKKSFVAGYQRGLKEAGSDLI